MRLLFSFLLIISAVPSLAGYVDNVEISPRCHEKVFNPEDFNFLSIFDEIVKKIKEDENFNFDKVPNDIKLFFSQYENTYDFRFGSSLSTTNKGYIFKKDLSFEYNRGDTEIPIYTLTFHSEEVENTVIDSGISVNCRIKNITVPATISGSWSGSSSPIHFWDGKGPQTIEISDRFFEKVTNFGFKSKNQETEKIYCKCKIKAFIANVDPQGFLDKFGHTFQISSHPPDYILYLWLDQVEWLDHDKDPEECSQLVDAMNKEIPEGQKDLFSIARKRIHIRLLEDGKVMFENSVLERTQENDWNISEHLERFKVTTINKLVPFYESKE